MDLKNKTGAKIESNLCSSGSVRDIIQASETITLGSMDFCEYVSFANAIKNGDIVISVASVESSDSIDTQVRALDNYYNSQGD